MICQPMQQTCPACGYTAHNIVGESVALHMLIQTPHGYPGVSCRTRLGIVFEQDDSSATILVRCGCRELFTFDEFHKHIDAIEDLAHHFAEGRLRP